MAPTENIDMLATSQPTMTFGIYVIMDTWEMFQLADLKPGENLVGRLKVTEMGQRFVELKEGRLTS